MASFAATKILWLGRPSAAEAAMLPKGEIKASKRKNCRQEQEKLFILLIISIVISIQVMCYIGRVTVEFNEE